MHLDTIDEILGALAARLRAQRLRQGLPQSELASMAGVSLGAVRTLESSGHSSLETLIRVAQALGRVGELDTLFAAEHRSIAQMEQADATRRRQRAPRRQTPP